MTCRAVSRLAEAIGTGIVGTIPMSSLIGEAELERKTGWWEAYPDSEAAESFRQIAEKMLANTSRCIPSPMTDEEVEALCR